MLKRTDRRSGKRPELFSILLLVSSLAFYLFFAFFDKGIICVDSPSYITMSLSREPFYPLLLAALRKLFGESGEAWLLAAAVLQSILAALCAWSLVCYLWKELQLEKAVAFFLLLLPMAVSLLCRFAAGRESMYSNSILTEGIAVSLYLLVFRYLLEYCFHQSRKSLVLSCLLCFIMVSTRKQMLVCPALLALCILGTGIVQKHLKRALITCALSLLLVFSCVFLLDRGYNYALRGDFVGHSSDNRFLATMVFYTAEKEDAGSIQDPQIRNLFLDIYNTCDENGYLKHSAGKGWLNRVTHFGDYYDSIQINTMWPGIREYVNANYEGGEVELEEKIDKITSQIISSLLPAVWPGILASFADNFLSGLVTTVAQRTPLLIWYSILAYAVYLALLIRRLIANPYGPVTVLGLLTAASILLNVAAVSAVIFCQTRYTIYNMPLFYISGFLLLWETLKEFIQRKQGRLTGKAKAGAPSRRRTKGKGQKIRRREDKAFKDASCHSLSPRLHYIRLIIHTFSKSVSFELHSFH